MQKYSVSDYRSKLGKKADMRTTVITAAERFRLIERSLEGTKTAEEHANMEAELGVTAGLNEEEKRQKVRQLVERSTKRNLLTVPGTHNPEIKGILSGKRWNKFVEDVWSGPDPVIIHTILMPPGKNARQVSLTGAKILSSSTRVDDDAATITEPHDPFEAFVETDCIPANRFIPNHFVVTNTRPLSTWLNRTAGDQEVVEEFIPPADSEWYKEALKYSETTE